MLSLLRLECKQKNYANPFQICIFLFLSLLIWNWNDKICSYTPVVPSKTIPNSRPKWAKCMPVSDQHGAKTLSDGDGTYLYGLYKGIPHRPLPPPQGLKYSAVSITIHICNSKSSVYVQLFDLSQPKAVGKTYRSSRFLALNPLMEPWKWNLFVSQYLTLHCLFSRV